MRAYGLTGRLASYSSRNPWKIVLLWVALLVIGGGLAAGFMPDMTSDANLTNKPESDRANALLRARMDASAGPNVDEFVIVASNSLSVEDSQFQQYVEGLVNDIRAFGPQVEFVSSWYELHDDVLLADDRKAMMVPVGFWKKDIDEAAFVHLIDAHDGQQGFTVVTGGENSISEAFTSTSEADLQTGETIGISVAMLVLIIVFGTLVSAGVPLVLAIVASMVGLGVTAIVGHIFELSVFVINMMVMIGLAVGIDYSLFIVGRYREERGRGLETISALTRTGDTASKAVLFSGLTVVTALLGMLFVPSTLFRSLGAGAIIVVIVAVFATLTLLPAGLSLVGGGIERGRGRVLMGALTGSLLLFALLFVLMGVGTFFIVAYLVLAVVAAALTVLGIDPFHRRDTTGGGRFWEVVARVVMTHPVALVVVSVALLGSAALSYATINLGQSGISTLPHSSSPYRAFTLIESRFSSLSLENPTAIVVDAPNVNAPDVQAAINGLVASIKQDPDFTDAVVTVNTAGTLAKIDAHSSHDTQSSPAIASVKRLRSDVIPSLFQGVQANVLVGGPTAETIDFSATVDTYTPIIFAFVLGVSFLLLMVAFRSLIVPLKSVILNLLSVGASYGLLVLVFQHGIGNELFGFRQVDRIDAWIPLMMFSILFGLSMDYHVFLLSRIRERYDYTHNNIDSITHGLRSTASMITGAALIMVAVFGGFAMGELSMFQQLGFGLAIAVVIDATVIRSILVPAMMRLLGDLNWYFPRWLEWLPKLNVEGVPETADDPHTDLGTTPSSTTAD
jgi:RND superfamily putative drug exporter